MTEEEYFRKNYPDSCYGDKPLSPHWDFFQDGVEFGERQSEKRIAELELKIKHLTKHLEPQSMTALFEQVEEEVKQEQRIKELEVQIEQMKCCYNCKQSQDENYCKIKKSDVDDLSCWDCGCDKWEMKEND